MAAPATANGHRERLRKRFMLGGSRAFLDHEIVEMLLAHVVPRGDTKALAYALIEATDGAERHSGSRPRLGTGVATVLHQPLRLLAENGVKGFGGAMAVHLEAVRETAARMAQTSESDAPILGSWNAVGAYCRRAFAKQQQPAIAVLMLDYRHRLLVAPLLFRIDADIEAVTRQTMTAALRHAASGTIVVRISPDGNLADRTSDHRLARNIRDAGSPISVLMHDYIIVAADNFMSLRNMGVLELAPLYDPAAEDMTDSNDGWYSGTGEALKTLQDRVAAGEIRRLLDHDLLSLLLRRAVADAERDRLANELLARFGSLGKALTTPIDELIHVLSQRNLAASSEQNEVMAIQLAVIGEAAQRHLRAHILHAPPLSEMTALMRYCRAALAYDEVEQLYALFLNKDKRLLWDEALSRGTINSAPVQPREIAGRALRLGASYIVLVHNHPTGDPSPSEADVSMTLRVDHACHSIGVRVLDHIVVAATGHASLYEHGRMPRMLADTIKPRHGNGASRLRS